MLSVQSPTAHGMVKISSLTVALVARRSQFSSNDVLERAEVYPQAKHFLYGGGHLTYFKKKKVKVFKTNKQAASLM